MKVRKGKWPNLWILLFVALLIIISVLFALEYLGSEQEQKIIEQPLALPTAQLNQE